jgi:Anthranilate/para-aminobenzoate synthases component I
MLNWSKQFSILVFLDSNNYSDKHGRYECMMAAGVKRVVSGFDEMQQLHAKQPDWLFGHIAYDYKNTLEPKLSSAHEDKLGFSQFYFFVPDVVLHINSAKTELTIECFDDPAQIHEALLASSDVPEQDVPKLTFTRTVSQNEYLQTIDALRKHIADGDCYEINYCCEGYSKGVDIQPLSVYNALNALSPAPFSTYYRNGAQYMMCASPERYVCKRDTTILSQPIKGTARRDADAATDERIKNELLHSIKDRAENVMIVDLVRNDLARSCEVGSIQVDELFGIYTFPQVHQMVSTVSGKLKTDAQFTDALHYSFPMGSMTGAPKVKVMELIERYEQSRRGLFSGTIGYISPDGDFDFNVIIRSLFYNSDKQYLSYQTGGAITYDSNPQQEWEEMRLKAWALERVFS